MTSNPTTISISPDLSELPALVAAIETFAETNDLPMPDAMALTLAAEELFTNTVRHGHASTPATLTLSRAADTISFLYSDSGLPFDTAAASADVDTTLPVADRPIGGLGLHMIARTMQAFTYERRDGRNVTTLTRLLGAKKLVRE